MRHFSFRQSFVRSLPLSTFMLASAASPLQASEQGGITIYIDASATGANDGTSWGDAYTSLQDALTDAAGSGGAVSEIWVAKGTYKPDQGINQTPGDRSATFQLLSGVAIYGGFVGGETTLDRRNPEFNVTVLSGDLAGDDAPVACTQNSPDCNSFGRLCAYNGLCIISDNNDENSYHVVTGSNTDGSAVLDGFTVTGGNADGFCCVNDRGGGMFNTTSSPTVINCTFSGNSARSRGGGIYNVNSNPAVSNCTFSGNSGGNLGGGMYNGGGTVTRCTFNRNAGGGIFNNGSSPTVSHCTFNGNSFAQAGGIANFCGSPTVTHCTFSGNSGVGGGMYNGGGNPAVTDCTFSGNSSAINNHGGSIAVTNCILWDNGIEIQIGGQSPVINYSIVKGGWPYDGGTGVLDADPLFIDALGPDGIAGTGDENLRVFPGSPAIDAGDNDAVPADVLDLDGDGDTTEPIPFDLYGNPRFVDDPETSDTGNGTPPIVDMGAYEYQGPSDCNLNGVNDPCDVSCGPAGRTCDVPDCGMSNDVNGNLIPDECDECVADDVDCNDQNICTFDKCDIAVCAYEVNGYGDVDHNGTVNLFDLFCILNCFADEFEGNCTFLRCDIDPCAGNGTINLQDLFAVLNAINDIDPCCGP